MAFRREVSSLEKLVLKFISKAPRQLNIILNDHTLERAHRIGKPDKSRTHKAKQEVIRALLRGGRVGDDTLPKGFFHTSMTRIEIIGAKISTPFVEMVRLVLITQIEWGKMTEFFHSWSCSCLSRAPNCTQSIFRVVFDSRTMQWYYCWKTVQVTTYLTMCWKI